MEQHGSFGPREIDRIATEFEEQWSTHENSGWESWLTRVPAAARWILLQELLQVEVEMLRKHQQTLDLERYRELGSEAVELVQELAESARLPGSAKGELGLADTESRQPQTLGRRIGPYKLLQIIGEGGMGSVWMAEQDQPVRRRVALKLIKDGIDNRDVLARFEAERQALAMMDHPNIARVLDAGTTSQGRPYFVMELVKGIPITTYCDNHKLGVDDRLKLFMPVCKAVQHAHQKGIIHRDLKPSNVLVCLSDGEATPKVIDFGLAKALEHTTQLTDKTIFTEFGRVVGTLQYMSPEQAEANPLDVDTRTDVYSLGVMLYELLTGTTPLGAAEMKQQALLKVLELIREQEPPRPSTRLSSSGESIVGISQQRRIAPSRLQQILKGELDWVVMKAIEKDRNRRYASASSFAEDIEHYLTNEPVVARPPSAGYRLQKVFRRHRGLFASLATIMALLIFGLVTISLQNILLEAQRKQIQEQLERAYETEEMLNRAVEVADAANKKAEQRATDLESALQQARTERSYAEAVTDFVAWDILLLGSVEGQDRSFGRLGAGARLLGTDPTVREALDRASETLSQRPDLSPASQAKLRWIMGVSYRHLGEAQKAIDQLEIARQLADSGEMPKDFQMQVVNSLAAAYSSNDQTEPAAHHRAIALELSRELEGPDSWNSRIIALILALEYQRLGRDEDAAGLVDETLDLFVPNEEIAANGRQLLELSSYVIEYFRNSDAPKNAVDFVEELMSGSKFISLLEREGPLPVANFYNDAGSAYFSNGMPEKAIPLFHKALETQEQLLEPNSQSLLITHMNLANNYDLVGNHEAAINHFEVIFKHLDEFSLHMALATIPSYIKLLESKKDPRLPVVVDASLEMVRRKSSLNPQHAYAILSKCGATLSTRKQYALARKFLEAALEVRDDDNVRLIYGGCLFHLGELTAATDILRSLHSKLTEPIAGNNLKLKTVAALYLSRIADSLEDPETAQEWQVELKRLRSLDAANK